MKKIKGHIIAKIILIVPLAMLLILMSVQMKSIDESIVQQNEIKMTQTTPNNIFDRIDIIMEKGGNKMYRVLQPMSIFMVWVWSIFVSVITVIALDRIGGVGRESPLFNKQIKSTQNEKS